MIERDLEAYLVKRVKALGGEVRKVQWGGRSKAPDRVVMLPVDARPYEPEAGYTSAIWVELKATGGLATFPKNAHERGQWREHERMRKMGQRVVVIDSIEGVEELLS